MLINRSPAPVETYNDIDSELVTFFRVLRDQKDALIEAIGLTPFSREELARACTEPTQGLPDLERARRFFVRARQVRTGLAQTASAGRWAHCLLTSRAGMAGAVSRWLGSIEDLSAIAQRLLRVQIENSPALEVLVRYDSPETLFYCDPPYVHETRGDVKAYRHEMTDENHRALAHMLNQVQGKVALSGYQGPLYETLYKGWWRVEADPKLCHSVKQERTEILWLNYDPAPLLESSPQLRLYEKPGNQSLCLTTTSAVYATTHSIGEKENHQNAGSRLCGRMQGGLQ